MSEWKYVVDTQSKVVQAKREGRKEGRQERDREIVRNLKQLGTSVEQIAQATGLSLKEIAAL
jgi:predicted transposase/invertase (TIGR01784 family)